MAIYFGENLLACMMMDWLGHGMPCPQDMGFVETRHALSHQGFP